MTEDKLQFYLVDAISPEPFSGCGTALVEAARVPHRGRRLKLARALGQPVCGFYSTNGQKLQVEWYSPERPVKNSLTGLAAAVSLLAERPEPVEVEAEGQDFVQLQVEKREGHRCGVSLSVKQIEFAPFRYSRDLLAGALGLDRYTMPDHWPLWQVGAASWTLVVPVMNVEAMGAVRPDYDSIGRLCRKIGVERCTLYTWQGNAEMRLRTFAPLRGIFEQPASAASAIAAAALAVKEKALPITPPSTELYVLQGVETGRTCRCRLIAEHSPAEIRSVELKTEARIAGSGEFFSTG
ncbi:MAG: PhzF family phenazine biosynthesis protein [Deltaproteobacteria bacterium]|nr:MAG: PhzF family phenazine biosynthesis protein [Deltaproteobacteria bacterium]